LTEVNAKGDGEDTVSPTPYHINVRTMELALVVVSDEPVQLLPQEAVPKLDKTIPLVDVPEVSTATAARATVEDELPEIVMV
jgi:formylmethanofuran dehydrogenase subunit B